MTTTAFGDATVTARTGHGDPAGAPRDVADLVRQCSRLDGRRGFRIAARGTSGHIFFDRGRVIHAEFGEDCGLRAVVEMLRAGSVLVEPAVSWPSQPSLNLGPELLLSMTGKDASRVVRKVDLPVEPPPLPDPDDATNGAGSAEGAAAGWAEPVQPEAAPPASRRAISGIMPRIADAAAPASGPSGATHPTPAAPRSVPSRTPTGRDAYPAVTERAGGPRAGATPGASAPGAPSVASSGGAAALGASTNPGLQRGVRAPRLPAPPRQEPKLPASSSLPSSSLPARASSASPSFAPRQPAELPVTRAQKARSRSVVVARAAKASALARAAGSPLTPPQTPIQAPCGQQPTTMVRIASRGDLLAARGENAEQLAEAAAFIHGLANLIAADFGRQGRANVHLSGHGVSLLVARSEVNDIAAALGPTERLSSLLTKVGLK